MIDYKNIGDSQVTKAQKQRNRLAMFTMAEWCILGLCAFTTLYMAIRAY